MFNSTSHRGKGQLLTRSLLLLFLILQLTHQHFLASIALLLHLLCSFFKAFYSWYVDFILYISLRTFYCVLFAFQFSFIVAVQSLSCPTLCNPMDCNKPGFPVLYHLPELAQTHVHWVGYDIQPSHLLSPPSSPTLNLSQHQGVFQRVGTSHQVAKVLELLLQHQSF